MRSKNLTRGILIFYWAALAWIIVFKMSFSFAGLPHLRNINLIPFAESVIVNVHLDTTEIFQNLAAFVPFGVLIHALWDRKPLVGQILPILLSSLLFETVQYLLAIGASDMTDLLMNTLGGILGIGIAALMAKLFPDRWKLLINAVCILCGGLLAALIVVLIAANL